MNVKTVSPNPILQIDPKARTEVNQRAKASADRDADGKREQQEEAPKRHLTQQEFDDALRVLNDHPGLKTNNLEIKVEERPEGRIVFIIDPDGKIIRRLSESQLWLATRDRDRQTGRILDKAM